MVPGLDQWQHRRGGPGLLPSGEDLLDLGVMFIRCVWAEAERSEESFVEPGAVVQAFAAFLQVLAENLQRVEVLALEGLPHRGRELGAVLFTVECRLGQDGFVSWKNLEMIARFEFDERPGRTGLDRKSVV